jgi:hypothetical protein
VNSGKIAEAESVHAEAKVVRSVLDHPWVPRRARLNAHPQIQTISYSHRQPEKIR